MGFGVCCLFLLLTSVHADLYRRGLQKYENARCNDGTEGVYYGTQNYTGQKKYVLQLEGGGFCHTIESCRERCAGGNYLCETNPDPTNTQTGILSDDPSDNPPFHDYYKAELHYCTGDLHAGTNTASNETGNMHFTGRNNIMGMVHDLINNYGMAQAEHVVISGTSAGGFGAVFACGFLREILPNARFLCLVDSLMMFPNISYFEPDCEGPMEIFTQGRVLWGVHEYLNLTTLNWWQDIPDPLFMAHPMYDWVAIPLYCGDTDNDPQMIKWQEGMYEYVERMRSERPQTGIWMPGCFHHGYLPVKRLYTETRVGPENRTLSETLLSFRDHDGGPIHVVDRCTQSNIECGDCDVL